MIAPRYWVPFSGRRSQRYPMAGLGEFTLADAVRRVATDVPLLAPRLAVIKDLQKRGKLSPQLYRDYRAWVDALRRVYIDVGARFRTDSRLLERVAKESGMKPAQVLAAFDQKFPSVIYTGMSGYGLGIEPITLTVIAVIAAAVVLTSYNLSAGERAAVATSEEASKRMLLSKEMTPEQLKEFARAEGTAKPPPPTDLWGKVGTYLGLAIGGLLLVAVLPSVLPRLLPKAPNPRRRARRPRRRNSSVYRSPMRRVKPTLREFIAAHRDEVDQAIRRGGGRGPFNDEERRMWVMNDEGLYQWARSCGVRI